MDILKEVWSAQPGRYIVVSRKYQGRWKDEYFEDPDEAIAWIKQQPEDADIYWCPLKFNEPRRKKEYVAPTNFLWADLDEADPHKLDPELRPTIAWESSPNRYQGLWRLATTLAPALAEQVNKTLSYYIGADKGGWDLTQVLRVPGTRNNKYPKRPRVRLLWSLDKQVDPQKFLGFSEEESDSPPDNPDPEAILLKHRKRIPRKVMRLLLAEEAPKGRRSDVLWYIEHELLKAGLSAQEVFVLVKGSAWNKYRGRSDEDFRLKEEIARAVEDEVLRRSSEGPGEDVPGVGHPGRLQERSDQADEEDAPAHSLSIRIENDRQFMGTIAHAPGWTIRDFWTRRSHGIIAGEPKSFKTTIALDMAVSVASGKPFLGKYPVEDQGPVLVIQEENSPWILKDYLEKIRSHKGLVGRARITGEKLRIEWPPTLPIYYVNQQGILLSDPLHQKLITQVIEKVEPIMMILDPLYLMFDGNTNDAKDLNPVLSWLLRLKDDYDLNIVLIHHMGKATDSKKHRRGGQLMLGSTILHGWTESALYIYAESTEEKGRVHLKFERELRGAGVYPMLEVNLRVGDMGDPTYEVEVIGEKDGSPDPKKEVLLVLQAKRGVVSQREISELTGLSRRQVKASLEALARDGLVALTEKGARMK